MGLSFKAPLPPNYESRLRAARPFLLRDELCVESDGPCLREMPGQPGVGCTARPDSAFFDPAAPSVCHWQDAWALRRVLRNARLPELYWDSTFDKAEESFRTDPRTAPFYQKALDWVANSDAMIKGGAHVIITGDVGKGKTYLAMCMANALIEKGVWIYRVDAPRLGSVFYECMEKRDGSLARFRKILYDCDVLFLEEWMAQALTDFINIEFQTIIRERTNRNRPIVITTNYGQKDVLALYTDPKETEFRPIISRLFSNAHIWPLKGADYRGASKRIGADR